MPLHMRLPKLKGFNNPFRVEYQGINLDTIEESGLDEISPATLQGKGLAHKGALVKVLGRGRAHPEGDRARPMPSPSPPRQPSPPPGVRWRSCRSHGATAVPRCRATSSPTADRDRPLPLAAPLTRSPARAVQRHERVQDPRSSGEDPLHPDDHRPLPDRLVHPGPGHRPRRRRGAQAPGRDGRWRRGVPAALLWRRCRRSSPVPPSDCRYRQPASQ